MSNYNSIGDDTLASLGKFQRYKTLKYGDECINADIKPMTRNSYVHGSPGRKNNSETRQESNSCYTSSGNYNKQVEQTSHQSNRNTVTTKARPISNNNMDQHDDFRETHDDPSGKSAVSIDSQEMYALRMMQTKQKKIGGDKGLIIKKSNATSKSKLPWIKSKSRNKDDSSSTRHGIERNSTSMVHSDSKRAGSTYSGENSDLPSSRNRDTYNRLHNDGRNFVEEITAKLDAQRKKFMNDIDDLYNISGNSESSESSESFESSHNLSDSYGNSYYTSTDSENDRSKAGRRPPNERSGRDQSVQFAFHKGVEVSGTNRNIYNHPLSIYSDVSGSFDDDEVNEKEKGEKFKVVTMNGKKFKVRNLKNARMSNENKITTKAVINPVGKQKEQKKTRFRSIKIDENHKVTDKSDPRAKVMRIKKLTRNGLLTAEFTTIDPLNTPLHIACLTHHPTDFIIEHLLHHDENAISTENNSFELPIHYAAMDTIGVDPVVFEALIRQYPDSIHHENIEGSLPIHVACQVGAPSLFVIETLLDMSPEQVFAKSRLQVPVSPEEISLLSAIHEVVDKDKQIEYGWTPLHLAVLNGAHPLVLEAIINTNVKCLSATTNRGRTPMDCAKHLLICSIMNQVPIEELQNIFYALEVMQSYEIDKRINDELIIKASCAKEALRISDSYGWYLADAMLSWEYIKKSLGFKQHQETIENEPDHNIMKVLTGLHIAVIKREEPEVIQVLIRQSPECIDLVSRAQKISPYDLSIEMLIKGIQSEDLVSSNLYNTFEALKAMQNYKRKHKKWREEPVSIMNLSNWKVKKQQPFGSRSDKFEYIKTMITLDQRGKSLLGDYVDVDNDEVFKLSNYRPPVNLNYINFTLNVNVGYRRLRKAFLSNKSELLTQGVFSNSLKYQNVRSIIWDRHNGKIGDARLNDREKCSDYIGARKVFSYIVPKCNVFDAHVVYDSMEIIEYNDYCFGVVSVLKEPDIPNGSEYETKLQTVVIDEGRNKCKMICSSQVDVTGMRQNVHDDWQIRKVYKYKASNFFRALAETIILNSGDGSRSRI